MKKTITFIGGSRDDGTIELDDESPYTPINGSLPWKILENGLVQRYELYEVDSNFRAIYRGIMASPPGVPCNSPDDCTLQ